MPDRGMCKETKPKREGHLYLESHTGSHPGPKPEYVRKVYSGRVSQSCFKISMATPCGLETEKLLDDKV